MSRPKLWAALPLACLLFSYTHGKVRQGAVDSGVQTSTQPKLNPQRQSTLHDLAIVKRISDHVISPSGSQVLYVLDEPNLDSNAVITSLWKQPTNGLPGTKLSESVSHPRWSPDESKITFIRREGGYQIWQMTPNGLELQRLTNVDGGVWTFEWSPDGKKIAFIASEPATISPPKPLVDGGHRPRNQIYILDINLGSSSQLTKLDRAVAVTFGGSSISWSPDGKRLAFAAQTNSGLESSYYTDLYAVSVETGNVRTLLERAGMDHRPIWSPDGSQIAFISSYGKVNRLASCGLSLISAQSGKLRDIGETFEGGYFDFGTFNWSADNKTIYFEAAHRTTTQLFALEVTSGRVLPISPSTSVHTGFSLSKDRTLAVFRASNPKSPAELYVSKIEGFSPKQLTNFNPELKSRASGDVELIKWQNANGVEIEGLLVKPVGYEPRKRYPLLTFVHAGPELHVELSYDLSWFATFRSGPNIFQYLAANGYAVFLPNFRGSSGYGEQFRRALYRNVARPVLEDILEGVDFLIARGIAEPSALGIFGWSYGGYQVAWTVTQTDRFGAAVAGAAPVNLDLMYGEGSLTIWLESLLGGPPWRSRDEYVGQSPLNFAHRARTPTLILQGQADGAVSEIQARAFHTYLQKNNVRSQLVVYPGEGHSIVELSSQLDLAERVLKWFDTELKYNRPTSNH